MVTLPPDQLGRYVELAAIDITPQHVRRYAEAIDDRSLAAGPCDVAPLGFALAMRGGPVPEVRLADETVSVHAGHAITMHRPLAAPGVYGVRARISDVFEKSGRSGPLTVIARRAEIYEMDGRVVVTIDDQQIVRWRPEGDAAAAAIRAPGGADREGIDQRGDASPQAVDPEVGALVGLERRRAPAAEAIARYAQSLGGREPLFVDRDFAHSLGYADVIVPGPLQSALMEAMLRRCLPGWELRRLSLTFHVSIIACEPISLGAIVVERHVQRTGTRLVCDLSLENSEGERAALGSAELHAVAD